MKCYVYILYSEKLDRFYIGSTSLSPKERLLQHNTAFNVGSFTTRGIPWEIYETIECSSREQALGIERHIKKMKSKTYIKNLQLYPEIAVKLLKKYS